MIEKSTIEKVLAVFFEHPSKEFHLRELSRFLKLSMPTIISTTDALAKEKLIVKTKSKALTQVSASRDNINFVRCKRIYNLDKIYASGIVDYISKLYNYPKSIILFGSFSSGEDIESSDIDIAVTTNKNLRLDLHKYERTLKRPINVHETDTEKISKEFKANLANGIVLEGSW